MKKILFMIFALFALGVASFAFTKQHKNPYEYHQKSFSKISTDNLLALSWQNAFCQTHQNKRECRNVKPTSYQASHFTLHGLWPQPRNKINCKGARRARLDKDLYSELLEVMPAAKSGLQNHEWKKHGTCYGKDPKGYFRDAINLTKQVNSSDIANLFAKSVGKTLSLDQIRRAVDKSFGRGAGRKVKLKCKNGLITELWFNLNGKIDKDSKLSDLLKNAKRAKGGCKRGRVDEVGF